jgi:uncharacterized protein (TIGR03437 family)
VPALFTFDSSGSGTVAALNQDGSLNGPLHPAPAGSFVTFYGTGEGQTNPAGITGSVAKNVFPKPVGTVSVKIGNVDAFVQYAGAAPQEVAGVLQVNVKVPAGLPAGPNSLVLTVGGVSSPANVTLYVAASPIPQ